MYVSLVVVVSFIVVTLVAGKVRFHYLNTSPTIVLLSFLINDGRYY